MFGKVLATLIIAVSSLVSAADLCNALPVVFCEEISSGFCHVNGESCVGGTNMNFCSRLNEIFEGDVNADVCDQTFGICKFQSDKCVCATSNCNVNLVNPCSIIPIFNCTESITQGACKVVEGKCVIQNLCSTASNEFECLVMEGACVYSAGKCVVIDPCAYVSGDSGDCKAESGGYCKGSEGNCVVNCTGIPSDFCTTAGVTSFCHLDGGSCTPGADTDPLNHPDPMNVNGSFVMSVPVVGVLLLLLLLVSSI